jgi:hypothetical protein
LVLVTLVLNVVSLGLGTSQLQDVASVYVPVDEKVDGVGEVDEVTGKEVSVASVLVLDDDEEEGEKEGVEVERDREWVRVLSHGVRLAGRVE